MYVVKFKLSHLDLGYYIYKLSRHITVRACVTRACVAIVIMYAIIYVYSVAFLENRKICINKVGLFKRIRSILNVIICPRGNQRNNE